VPNGSVAGRVLSADGRPRAGIEVVIRDCDPATGAQTPGHVALVPTDRDGRFRFVDVLPGGHRLVLRAGSKDEVLQPVVTVAAGGTVAQDIVDR
jgi:hypothetical protein